MNYMELVDTMTPAIYRSFKLAVEIGKWPDGRRLTAEQRSEAMQAGKLHLPEEEQIGYIDKGHKAGDSCDEPSETTLKWQEDSRE